MWRRVVTPSPNARHARLQREASNLASRHVSQPTACGPPPCIRGRDNVLLSRTGNLQEASNTGRPAYMVDENIARLRQLLDQLEDSDTPYELQWTLPDRIRRAAEVLAGGSGSGRHASARFDVAMKIHEQTAKVALSASLVGSIRAASVLQAMVERWLLELVGQSRVANGGPSWGDVGSALSALDAWGDVIGAPISRQGARQRFARSPIVQRCELEGRVEVLRAESAQLAKRGGEIIGDPRRSFAEKKRDLAVAAERFARAQALLGALLERLDQLQRPDP